MKRLVVLVLALSLVLVGPQARSPLPAQADPLGCNQSAQISVSSATTVQLIAAPSGQQIHICSLGIYAGGTTNATFEYGTGSLCGTGTGNQGLPGTLPLTASAGYVQGNGAGQITALPASNAFCLANSAAVQVSGLVTYAVY